MEIKFFREKSTFVPSGNSYLGIIITPFIVREVLLRRVQEVSYLQNHPHVVRLRLQAMPPPGERRVVLRNLVFLVAFHEDGGITETKDDRDAPQPFNGLSDLSARQLHIEQRGLLTVEGVVDGVAVGVSDDGAEAP